MKVILLKSHSFAEKLFHIDHLPGPQYNSWKKYITEGLYRRK